jgi:mannitol-1-phosphate/altronate dehydrogenase
MDWTHAHIGTGKFGLGFVGYFSNICDSKTILLNRVSHDKQSKDRNEKLLTEKSYDIEYYNQESETIEFNNIHFYDDENFEELVKIISFPETTLLTTSVGYHHLPQIAPYIEEGLKARDTDSPPLFVLACENGHRSSSYLKENINQTTISDKKIEFLDCVVDQICDKFTERNNEPQRVVIQAENYREWIIEERNPDIKQYLNHPAIKFVNYQDGENSPLELYEVRKRWLVNGLHMAVAIIGTNFMSPNALIADVVESRDERIKKRVSRCFPV